MSFIFLLGRILFGGYFLEASYNHFKNYKNMAGYAGSKGIKNGEAAVIGSGVLLLIGGLSMVSGLAPGIGLIALALFLIPVTFTMHTFWKETDPMMKANQRIQFGKNMALLGAVLMMASISGPWLLSL